MAHYLMLYNSYQNTVRIVKDNSLLRKNGMLCKGLESRSLHAWFKEDFDWAGFGHVMDDDNNEYTCKIAFIGRNNDYLAIQDYFEKGYVSKKGTLFSVTAKYLCDDEVIIRKFQDVIVSMYNNKKYSEKQIKEIWQYIDGLNKNLFVISAMGELSAGKSTLLNSLMHTELFPVSDMALTHSVVEIYDNDNEKIDYETYDFDGELLEKCFKADSQSLSELYSNKDIGTIKVFGNIPGLKNEHMRLMFRETPGIDNRCDRVTNTMYADAQNMSIVLFVLKADQLYSNSNYELLSSIANEIKEGKQTADRFLFVVNRLDDWIKKPHQAIGGLVDRTKELLLQVGIDNPRIFFITASLASNIWKERNGYESDFIDNSICFSMLDLFKNNFSQVRFNECSSISSRVASKINEDLEKAKKNGDATEIALIHSGLKGLEYSIMEYIDIYAYPIMIIKELEKIAESIVEDKRIYKEN